MEIFEIAAELGKALKEDARLKRLDAAKEVYQKDAEIQKHMVEYEVQQRALQNEIVKEERDTVFVDLIQKRIDELYNLIMENPIFKELSDAQAEVNELMNDVNNTISYNITGEMPSCTHDCSTCGGSCGH